MSFTPILLLFFLHFIYLAEGLNIHDLDNVIQKLEDAQFKKADWEKLGRKLGLHKNTLDMINANERGDVDKCFTECLVKWLSRSDDVDSKCNGKPSFSSLADALDQMGSNKNQADYIRGLSKGKKPAKRQKLDPASTKKCGPNYKYNDEESEACAADEETDGPPQDKWSTLEVIGVVGLVLLGAFILVLVGYFAFESKETEETDGNPPSKCGNTEKKSVILTVLVFGLMLLVFVVDSVFLNGYIKELLLAIIPVIHHFK